MVVSIAALAALNTKMCPAQGLGHTAGGNPIDLHYKGDKNQRAGKCCDKPFSTVIYTVNFSVAADYLVLFRSRKQPDIILKNSIKTSIIDKTYLRVKKSFGFNPKKATKYRF